MIESVENEFRKNLLWWHETDEDCIEQALDDFDNDFDVDDIVDSADINIYWVEQYKKNPYISEIPEYVREFCRDIYNTYPTISSTSAKRLWLLRCAVMG